MPLTYVVGLLSQVVGALLALFIALEAWGALGAGGWLAAILYLVGDALLSDDATAPPDDANVRGQ